VKSASQQQNSRDTHKYSLLAKGHRLKASHCENSVTAENAGNAENGFNVCRSPFIVLGVRCVPGVLPDRVQQQVALFLKFLDDRAEINWLIGKLAILGHFGLVEHLESVTLEQFEPAPIFECHDLPKAKRGDEEKRAEKRFGAVESVTKI
jgi:hypothetical protein